MSLRGLSKLTVGSQRFDQLPQFCSMTSIAAATAVFALVFVAVAVIIEVVVVFSLWLSLLILVGDLLLPLIFTLADCQWLFCVCHCT